MAKPKGAKQVIQNLAKIEKAMFGRIVTACQVMQAKVVNDARASAPVFITTLRQSILPGSIEVRRGEVKAFVVANADYASFVEYGTRPHFPPVDALKDWASKRLGDPNLAFPVARSISVHGTRPKPFMGPAILKNQSEFRRAMLNAVKM